MNTPNRPFVRGQTPIESETIAINNATQSLAEASNGKGIELDTEPVYSTEKLDTEKFLREELDVIFNEPGNENDPGFVEVNVNGDYRLALRNGEPFKLRRYHVAVIAQAKQSRVRQTKIVNPDGSMGFREDVVLSLTYPFSVVHDPNPKQGGPWLRQLLANPS